LFGNEINADELVTNDAPEPATNSQITDSSQVIIDYTPPHFNETFLITGTLNGPPVVPGTASTHERNVTLTFDCNDTNEDAVDVDEVLTNTAVARCLQADVADDGTTFRGPALITELTNVGALLTPEHGTKTVAVQYVDRAGNTDVVISGTSDTIELDAFFQNVDVAGASPEEGLWEDYSFTVSGEIVHPQFPSGDADLVLVDFKYLVDTEDTFDFPDGFEHPSNLQIVSLVATGDPEVCRFTASSTYPRPSQDILDTTDGTEDHAHTPEVTLVDFTSDVDITITPILETEIIGLDNEVDLNTTNDVIVLEHPPGLSIEAFSPGVKVTVAPVSILTLYVIIPFVLSLVSVNGTIGVVTVQPEILTSNVVSSSSPASVIVII